MATPKQQRAISRNWSIFQLRGCIANLVAIDQRLRELHLNTVDISLKLANAQLNLIAIYGEITGKDFHTGEPLPEKPEGGE